MGNDHEQWAFRLSRADEIDLEVGIFQRTTTTTTYKRQITGCVAVSEIMNCEINTINNKYRKLQIPPKK
jgi:hypothetical protein